MTRRLSNGDAEREALRSLKRRLTDVIYRTMIKDTQTPRQAAQPHAA